MSTERRTEFRAEVDLTVRVRSSNVEDFVDTWVRNISAGGLYIEAEHPLPVGTEVWFRLQIQDESPLIEGAGRVAWRRLERSDSQPPGMGVQFTDLPEASRGLVETFVEQRGDHPGRFAKGR